MGRYPRYQPPTESDSTLVEITCRTTQGRALLRPGGLFNRRVYGVIGRAQELYQPEIHAFGFLSTHYHALISFADVKQQRLFMQHVQGNLAREVSLLHDWEGPFWGRRYRGIPVSEEESAQYSRLRYVLENGCKEGLVADPREWPGPSVAWHLWQGLDEIEGEWVDRTAMYHARRTKEGASKTEDDFTEIVKIKLTPLPCFANLSKEDHHTLVREMIEDIATETRDRHRERGTRPLGEAKIKARHPHDRPDQLDRSPAPAYHCSSKEKRDAFWRSFGEFVSAYRESAECLSKGDLTVTFPPNNCFPPPRQFVAIPRARAPGTSSAD